MRIVAYVVVTTALTFGVQLLAVPLAGLPVQVTGWLYLAVAGPLVVGVTYGLPRRRPRSRGPAHRRDDLPHRRHGRRRRRARHSRPRGDRLGPALHHGGSAGRDRGSVRASGAHRPAHRAAGNPGGAHRARGVGGLHRRRRADLAQRGRGPRVPAAAAVPARRRSARVGCPLLVQIADLDQSAPPTATAAAAARAARAQVHHYPCDHFDVYPGRDWHEHVVRDQVAFLSRALAHPDGHTSRV
jgi:hypothetical protein